MPDAIRKVQTLVTRTYYRLLPLFSRSSTRQGAPHTPPRYMVWGERPALHSEDGAIPRLLWTYWEGERSPTTDLCMKSWNENIFGLELKVLTTKSVYDYLPDLPNLPDSIPPQKKSNLIRLMLLEAYGGIWIDSSTLLTKPLHWLIDLAESTGSEVLGFFNAFPGEYRYNPSCPIIENGLLVARTNSAFIRDWLKIYRTCLFSKDYRTYFESEPNYPSLTRNFVNSDPSYLSYFVCYIAAQKLMQESKDYRACFVSAEDDYYFTYYNTVPPMNRTAFAKELLIYESKAPPAIIKITGSHRAKLDELISMGCYRESSLLGKLIRICR